MTPPQNTNTGLESPDPEPADPTAVSGRDAGFLARAIEVARSSRRNGNHPFGAVLVTGGGAPVVVAGPALLAEAAGVHAGFWDGRA